MKKIFLTSILTLLAASCSQSQQAQNNGFATQNTHQSRSGSATTNSTYTTTEQVTSTASSTFVNVSISTDVTTTVSCGSNTCFQKNFSKCSPATLDSDAGFASVSYKIIGPNTKGCSMSFKYTKNPNPAWVNKSMTCTFNNTIDFQTSVQNTFNATLRGQSDCQGSLADILKSTNQ